MTRTDYKTPPANPHKHDHGLAQVDAAIAGRAPLVHAHPDITARLDAIEKEAAVTRDLLLAVNYSISDLLLAMSYAISGKSAIARPRTSGPGAPTGDGGTGGGGTGGGGTATVPGSPTGVSATAGDTTAAVTWTAPADNGGAGIINYQVTPYIGASAQTVVYTGSASTSKTVTGLTNGTAVTFKVAAINSVGAGAQSAASAAVTPAVPTGDVFYMSPTGSDAAAGTIGAPWATMQRFVDTNPAPGSTLYLRGGNYNPATDGFTCGRDTYGNLIGTAGAPITIRNYPGEAPIFPDAAAPVISIGPNETSNTIGANYLVIDGLQFPNASVDDAAVIVIGGFEPTLYLVKNITLRNLAMSLWSSSKSVDHCIGLIGGAENVIIEDSIFTGTPGGAGDAIVSYWYPGPLNTVMRRCIFKSWPSRFPIQWWDQSPSGTYSATTGQLATFDVRHCSFIGNANGIDARRYRTCHVYDNAFTTPSGNSSFDGTNSVAGGTPTLDHNFYSQQFDANYRLVAGQTGRSAASDGTDAGALDW